MAVTVHHRSIEVTTRGPGTYEVTDALERAFRETKLTTGMATVFCPHTSCSLVAMENASPEARRDLQDYLEQLVPEDSRFEHSLEGPDDMPSHIKMALTRTSESVPFESGRLLLGTWQGIYLWEHREVSHQRTVRFTFIGE